jgi:uncharacterized protein YjbI with pentapeptide repeats
VDLAGANLTFASLDADLAGADLANTNLQQVFLSGENFTGADLANASTGALLVGTNLTSANASEANLTNASFQNANLSGAILAGATLNEAHSGAITGTPSSLPADWSLRSGFLIGPGATLYSDNLSGINLSDTDLAGADVADANLTGADLAGANLTGTQFNEAVLDHANLSAADLADAQVSYASLIDAQLSAADVSGASLVSSNFSGAGLAGADLFGADAASVTWTGATCPDGTSASAHSTGCASALEYRFTGYITPRPNTTLPGYTRLITARFHLVSPANLPVSAVIAASLSAAKELRATLSGPGIKASTAYCSWSSSAGYFSCPIAVPHGIKAGQKNPYKITAAEMPGTSFLNAPVRGKTLNPETIYFG